MCHHWETERLEELEAELAETTDEAPEAEPLDAEEVGEQDDEKDIVEVPPADD